MRGSIKRTLSITLTVVVTGAVMSSPSASANDARLPRGNFAACSDIVTSYCIDSVTFVENGADVAGTWVPTGTAATDAAGVANTKTYTTFGTTATTYTGRWTYPAFPFTTRDFEGVFVRVAPANEFTDTMAIWVEPAGPDSAGIIGRVRDTTITTSNRVLSLPENMGIRVKLRLGALVPAVTIGAGSDVSVVTEKVEGANTMTWASTPAAIAQATSTADCDSETSIAAAKPNQMYAIVAFQNGRDPYGVPGLSGNMVVSSNGTCRLSTPTWNDDEESMDFVAAAPHFAPDGATVNTGFYRAVIPAADAGLLFGLGNVEDEIVEEPAGTVANASVSSQALISATKAMTVEVTETDDGSNQASSRSVAFDGTNYVVTATGFTYSTKKVTMRKGTPPNAPKAVKKVTVKRSKKTVTATFKAAKGSSYYVLLQRSKAKPTRMRCTVKKLNVTCTAKNLKKGTYTMRVTPARNGLTAKATTKRIAVP
jgi:hypothetical protein